eukprot:2754936-Rhodomonas_salina.1
MRWPALSCACPMLTSAALRCIRYAMPDADTGCQVLRSGSHPRRKRVCHEPASLPSGSTRPNFVDSWQASCTERRPELKNSSNACDDVH